MVGRWANRVSRRSASVVAREPTTFLVMTHDAFERLGGGNAGNDEIDG